ncbi:hypothetical protein HHI36_018288 [Cryptolaemus montrouzieri]|uniref:Uncharacterized protein n=1 Tax=Cryptolaemus montrouzieri TaxID=559131 RepID=A0ABD2P0U4_9CUCU
MVCSLCHTERHLARHWEMNNNPTTRIQLPLEKSSSAINIEGSWKDKDDLLISPPKPPVAKRSHPSSSTSSAENKLQDTKQISEKLKKKSSVPNITTYCGLSRDRN